MKNNSFCEILYKVAALFLGMIFLWAACSKCVDLEGFYTTVRKINVFSDWLTILIVLFVPGIEMVLGFCLLFGTAVKDAAFLGSVLLAVFVVLAIHLALNGNLISCGCFKTSRLAIFQGFTGWWIVSKDVILLGCSTFLLLFDSQHFRTTKRD